MKPKQQLEAAQRKAKNEAFRNHFKMILSTTDIEMNEEYQFHPKRKWRFDFADVENRIAVELEGGVWNQGAHVRGKGYIKDCEKYNEAVKLGWRLLRYPTKKSMERFEQDYKVIIDAQMKSLKIYEIDFDPMYPVPSGLIVLAATNVEAMKIAKETIKHTEPVEATLIEADEPKVVFYESGDY